jgi:hypothetical protein
MGLTKSEVKILKLINKSGFRGKQSVTRYLEKNLALNATIARDFYTLWFLNFREDGKYEEITEVDRDLSPLVDTLKKIQSGELELEDIPDKFYGETFNECSSSGYGGYYGSRSWNIPCPCVDLGGRRIIKKLDRETGEMKIFSGLHEEDLWKYYDSQSHYTDIYEEYEDEEFNYFNFNDETLEYIKQIAAIVNRNDVIEYIDGEGQKQSEELVEFLEDMIPEKDYKAMVTDYLTEIGYITTMERQKEVKEYYDKEIKYPPSRDGESFDVEIPIDKFIELIEDENPLTFSDIIEDEIELNDTIDLEHVWYDTGYWQSESNDHMKSLHSHLEGIIEKYGEEGVLTDYYRKLKQFEDIVKNTGLGFKRQNWRGAKEYQTKDGRLKLTSDNIDFEKEQITFHYDGEKHRVPLSNFMNWAQGSVLDLKYESVRYGKIPLMEEKTKITKISIFDFDGTLADTPHKEDGIAIWEAKTGKEYPHLGWYSKRESLDEDVFNVKLHQPTIMDYTVESKDPNTMVIMLTGRMPNQADQVEKILNEKGVVFEQYHYKERGDTFSSKINTIKKLLEQNPDVTEIEMWEDRENHADGFEKWGEKNEINLRVNRVSI